ncbi:AMP-binding protein [Streptomyces sp. M10(2022)]
MVALAVALASESSVVTLSPSSRPGAFLTLDPQLPAERIALMLEDSRPQLIVTQPAARPEPGRTPVLLLDDPASRRRCSTATGPRRRAGRSPRQPGLHAAHLGFTGRPKGVVLRTRACPDLVSGTAAGWASGGAAVSSRWRPRASTPRSGTSSQRC